MKKIRNLVILLVTTLLLTGCMKYNVTMDIKKDKSMEFKIVYALDTSVLGEKASFSDSDLEKMKAQGFEVEKYTDGTMEGFTLTKKIKNIDDVSSTGGTTYSLSGVVDNGDSKIFKVKKGLLKNKYTAKFDFDTKQSSLGNNNMLGSDDDNLLDKEETEDDTTLDLSNDDTKLIDTDEKDDLNSDDDYSKLLANMDISFSVKLPYAALSNNATTVKDDGKELVWNLASYDNKSIEFEFELDRFSIKPIIIVAVCILGGLFVIALIVTVIMAISGGKKPKTPTTTSEIKQ